MSESHGTVLILKRNASTWGINMALAMIRDGYALFRANVC